MFALINHVLLLNQNSPEFCRIAWLLFHSMRVYYYALLLLKFLIFEFDAIHNVVVMVISYYLI